MCVFIFSITFVPNISHSRKNSARCHKCTYVFGARGVVVGWGTALQTGRSWDRLRMVSLESFIDIILLAAPNGLASTQPLTGIFRGVIKAAGGRNDNPTTFMCQLSSNQGASTSWKTPGLSRPVQIALPLHKSSCKVTAYSCQILLKIGFSPQLFEKQCIFKFHEDPFSRSRAVPYGRTDMTKLTVAFRNFANAPRNGGTQTYRCGRALFPTNNVTLSCHHSGSTDIYTVQIFVNKQKPRSETWSEHFCYWIIWKIEANFQYSQMTSHRNSLKHLAALR